MAEVLKKFEFRHKNTKYPWGEWLDGRIWKLARNVDFKGEPLHFRQAAYQAAYRAGIRVRISFDDTHCVIQAYKPESES